MTMIGNMLILESLKHRALSLLCQLLLGYPISGTLLCRKELLLINNHGFLGGVLLFNHEWFLQFGFVCRTGNGLRRSRCLRRLRFLLALLFLLFLLAFLLLGMLNSSNCRRWKHYLTRLG